MPFNVDANKSECGAFGRGPVNASGAVEFFCGPEENGTIVSRRGESRATSPIVCLSGPFILHSIQPSAPGKVVKGKEG